MKSGDQKHQDAVEYHEDGTRVEILPRPYGASITTTKPDGSSETIKIGTRTGNPLFKEGQVAGYKAFEPSSGPWPQMKTILQSNHTKSSPSRTQIVSGIGGRSEGMSALRKRILGIGLLVICVGSMIEASDRYNGTPSLGWMVAMGATWALVVWLWPERKFQIGRALQLVGKRRLMRTRHKVSHLLKSNFLEEEIFEKILNDGKQNSLVNLLPGCATNGWRKMSKHELKDASVVLEHYLEDRLSSIRRLEKMIRKSITSEEVLLEVARKRKPVTDWRHMNYAEMKMMIAMTSGKKEDFDFLRSR